MKQGTQRNPGSTNGAALATPVLAGIVVAIGSLTLCGWTFGIPSLKTVFPGLVSMKANTAICFILAGLSLGLQSRPSPDPAALRRRLGRVLALAALCMGFLVLCEWIFGWDLGLDQLLFRDVPEPVALSVPGRMSPVTAINFTLLGLALFFLDSGTRRNRWPAQYLTLAVVAITLAGFIGYFYDIGSFYRVAPYASFALHTVIGFLLLCAGILLARPRRGVMALLMGATLGGIMVRRMLLPGVFVTVLFGGLAVLAERAGLYGFGFGTAVLVTALVALLAGLIWWVARALDRLELDLRESEERLRFALETSHAGAWDLDLEDHTAFRSLEHDRIFGYAELLPQWTYEMFLQHVLPQDRAAVDAEFRQATATQGVWSFECRIRRTDGEVRWIWAAGRHRADAAGGKRRMAGIVQDITERKQAEEDLRRLKDELEARVELRTAELAAANRELNDFAAIVSHDLKTPLRGLATLAKWLQSDYASKLDEEGREHLTEMIKRTNRMDRMIDDILQYSRLGRAEEVPEPVRLAELVPGVVQDMAPPAHAHVYIAPGLPVVYGEPVRLRQLFQNLIGNAIKYANKPQVEIRVEWAESDSLWRFSVADNGPGIEQRHFERIFKIFQTLAPKDKTDSTGVGLALVQRIVERAGGRVWVESRVGEGTTFYFTWPKPLRAGASETVERMAA